MVNGFVEGEKRAIFHLTLSAMQLKIEIGNGHGLFKLHVHEKNNLTLKFPAIVYCGQF